MDITISIGERIHLVSRRVSDAIIQAAKEVYEGKNAIVALEKDNTIQMKKMIFDDELSMAQTIAEFIGLGFKIHYVKR